MKKKKSLLNQDFVVGPTCQPVIHTALSSSMPILQRKHAIRAILGQLNSQRQETLFSMFNFLYGDGKVKVLNLEEIDAKVESREPIKTAEGFLPEACEDYKTQFLDRLKKIDEIETEFQLRLPVEQFSFFSITVKSHFIATLIYTTTRRLKTYPKGKFWPRETQCLVFRNNMLESYASVVEHIDEPNDNVPFAMIAATKKALDGVFTREFRRKIWRQLHNELNKIKRQ